MRTWLALRPILPLAGSAQAGGADGNYGNAGCEGKAQPLLPEHPKAENYLPLQVSATTPFVFFVDAKSVSAGLPFAR